MGEKPLLTTPKGKKDISHYFTLSNEEKANVNKKTLLNNKGAFLN